MEKHIYHGSSHIIEKPLYGHGKTYNDYGQGFYCTESLDMAKEWAAGKDADGYANSYIIDCEGLSILDLNSDQFTILNWLAVLLQNREFDTPSSLAAEAKSYIIENFLPDYEKYDILTGYRADDSYFSFSQDFINGTISYRQLSNAMRLGKLGNQFVLKSRKAFDRLKYTGSEKAESKEWYAKKMQRDKTARRDYFDTEKNHREHGDIYIIQIMDERMASDDPRLRLHIS